MPYPLPCNFFYFCYFEDILFRHTGITICNHPPEKDFYMNTTLLIVISAVNILLLLSFVFLLINIFRTKHSISENLQSMKQDMISANEQSLAQNRDEQNKNFSAARMENMQYFTNQQEMTKSSFSDFIIFLQGLQKEIQDSAANTNLKLQENLQKTAIATKATTKILHNLLIISLFY